MVRVVYDKKFQKIVSKIKDASKLREIKARIKKIIQNPVIGKPMKNVRKGTREVYAGPFRISYAYYKSKDLLEFLDIYHKDK